MERQLYSKSPPLCGLCPSGSQCTKSRVPAEYQTLLPVLPHNSVQHAPAHSAFMCPSWSCTFCAAGQLHKRVSLAALSASPHHLVPARLHGVTLASVMHAEAVTRWMQLASGAHHTSQGIKPELPGVSSISALFVSSGVGRLPRHHGWCHVFNSRALSCCHVDGHGQPAGLEPISHPPCAPLLFCMSPSPHVHGVWGLVLACYHRQSFAMHGPSHWRRTFWQV